MNSKNIFWVVIGILVIFFAIKEIAVISIDVLKETILFLKDIIIDTIKAIRG